MTHRRFRPRDLASGSIAGVTFPLSGLRVLDLTRVVAGPFSTRMLADLGADVVKVEPPDGDLSRLWGQRRGAQSGFYAQQNAGKRNISIDLKAPGAGDLVLELAAEADVVVENYRPGVLDRLGLTYEAFRGARDDIILCSISGFGRGSSWEGRAAFAPILHAEGGLIGRQLRHDGGDGTDPMLSIADTNAALHATIAILAALRLRDAGGGGQHIDIAMLNTMTVTDDYAHHALDGEPIVRLGGITWRTPFGHLLTSGNNRALWWQLSTAGVIDDGLGADASLEDKIRVRAERLEAFFDRDRDAVIADLDAANVAWGDVRDPMEVFDTAVAAERRLSTEIDDRAGGTRRVVESPYHFSSAEAGVRGPAPHRGEHNAEVLADWLGDDGVRLEDLAASGVLDADEPVDAS